MVRQKFIYIYYIYSLYMYIVYIYIYRCYMEMGEGGGTTSVSRLWLSQTGVLASITNTPTPMPPCPGDLLLFFYAQKLSM